MIKLWKRLSSKEFQIMFQSGAFFSRGCLSIAVKEDYLPSRVGFTMKKSKRSAVERNYNKRLLREAFIDIQSFIPDYWSIVLIANTAKGDFKLDRIRFELLELIDSAKNYFISTHENSNHSTH